LRTAYSEVHQMDPPLVTSIGDSDTAAQIAALEAKLAEHLAAVSDLQNELSKLKEQHRATGSSTTNLGSEPQPRTADSKKTALGNTLAESPVVLQTQYPLSQPEYTRYSRHLILPQHGLKGYLKLRSSRVLIVGAGGLGCPSAAYLAAAGVGRIGIVDGDIVEVGNLQRQIMYTVDDVGKSKAQSLVDRLTR
jgi:adenylyltransferase/sulfurtransferase